MKKMAAVLGMVAVLGMWVATPAAAQELAVGTWTGTMTPPGDQGVDVTYDVSMTDDDELSIVMSVAMMGESIEFFDIALDDDELTFWWSPGVRLDCSLARQDDGSFEGVCGDGAGGDGILLMVPPEGEGGA